MCCMEKQYNLGALFFNLSASIKKEIDNQLKKYRIDSKLAYVLFCLWEQEGVTQTVLSVTCGVANYSMTRMLDQLQDLGLIIRKQEADNRRAFQVFLTDDAKALETDVSKDIERIYASFLSDLSDEEKNALFKILNKLKA